MSKKFHLYSRSAVFSGAEKMLSILAEAIYTVSKGSEVVLNVSSSEFITSEKPVFFEINQLPPLVKISAKPISLIKYFIMGFSCFIRKDFFKNEAVVIFNDLESLIINWPVALYCKSFFYLHDSHKVSNYRGRLVCKIISLLVNSVLVITKSRIEILASIGVENTIYFPNCTTKTPADVLKNFESSEVHCLCIAQIAKWKRIDKVIEIFKVLAEKNNDKNWFLHICGRPAKGDQDALILEANIIHQSKTDIRIKYHGYKEDLSPLLQQSHLLISMSENEPFGLALVEALQYGCYIISAEGEGPSEIITSTSIGLLVSENISPERWVEEYNPLLCDNKMRNADQRFMQAKKYSFNRYCDNVSSALARCK